MAIANAIVMAKKSVDTNVVVTASKPTKKRVDVKVLAKANKSATANANELANNAKRANTNIKKIAVANVMAVIKKTTCNTKKMCVNVQTNSNGSNAKKAYIIKTAIINEYNTLRVRANIAVTANAIIIAKKRVDANIATTVNITAINARISANIAVIANTNKTVSNIRKYVPIY